MAREVATYVREFEDYSDGYDIDRKERSPEKETQLVNQALSSLEKRTLNFSIKEERSDKKTFGESGVVYQKTVIITKKDEEFSERELGMIEGVLNILEYKQFK